MNNGVAFGLETIENGWRTAKTRVIARRGGDARVGLKLEEPGSACGSLQIGNVGAGLGTIPSGLG